MKGLKKFIRAFNKEVVKENREALISNLEIFNFDFQGFAGILDKSRKMGDNPSFCSALPEFLYQKVRKESYFLDTIEEIEENLK